MWRWNDSLCHHGIKGMKWGVRRYQNPDGTLTNAGKLRYSDGETRKTSSFSRTSHGKQNSSRANFHTSKIVAKTKNGETLSITEDKTPAFAKLIAKHFPKIRNELERSKNCTIRDRNGKRVGELQLYKETPDSLNIVWLGVDEGNRGKGYAQSVMKAAEKFARDNNLKQLTLEVPGISPDARHIYEKQGFVAGEKISDDDDAWGGLTKMRKKL